MSTIANGVEIRAELARGGRGLAVTIERATHAVQVAEPGGDPQCLARDDAGGDEIHRLAVPVTDERVLHHGNPIGGHPVRIGAAVEQVAHRLGLHVHVAAELHIELALEIESLRSEPIHDRAHGGLTPLSFMMDGETEQVASFGRIVVRGVQQIGMGLDYPFQLVQIRRLHGLPRVPHGDHFPLARPPRFPPPFVQAARPSSGSRNLVRRPDGRRLR